MEGRKEGGCEVGGMRKGELKVGFSCYYACLKWLKWS